MTERRLIESPVRAVTEICEAEAVEMVFSKNLRGIIAEELQISQRYSLRLQVPGRNLGLVNGPGDIDVLLVPEGDCSRSIAIECKRFKFTREAVVDQEGEPNKLSEIEKGVRQADKLAKAGFHRTYLLLIVQVDARSQEGANRLACGLSFKQATKVLLHPALERLGNTVGLIYVEVIQAVDRPVEDEGGIGIKLIKPATECVQGGALTSALSRTMTKSPGAL